MSAFSAGAAAAFFFSEKQSGIPAFWRPLDPIEGMAKGRIFRKYLRGMAAWRCAGSCAEQGQLAAQKITGGCLIRGTYHRKKARIALNVLRIRLSERRGQACSGAERRDSWRIF